MRTRDRQFVLESHEVNAVAEPGHLINGIRRAAAGLIATAVLLVLGIASGTAEAAEKCLSRSEARALYRTSYIYWRNVGGSRCWSSSSRRGRGAEPHRLPRQAAVVVPRQPPPSLSILEIPLEALVEIMPPWLERSAFDPRLAWAQGKPADALEEAGPVFTTFQGEQPDVWPPLPQPEPANAAGLAIVVATGLLAAAFGLGLWRWNRARVRVTP